MYSSYSSKSGASGSSSGGGGNSGGNSGGGGGDTLTVTCFTCGTPSSKEWAALVDSRPRSPNDLSTPFYPFLQTHQTPINPHNHQNNQYNAFNQNGSTYLCAFCNALLESQWNCYEGKKEAQNPHGRKYVIHKFICAVCGVETYRKRVRALPFQEFPFLSKTRQPGSITLGNNPLAVVCLDCSETLWAQSAEYDRWGLPVHKRHFNWMARPPPPEDSVEATVARLPSGETQLPRCPPTDPLVPPKTNEPTALPETIPPIKYVRPRANSSGVNILRGGGGNQPLLLKYCSPMGIRQGHGQGQGSPLALTRGPLTSPRKASMSHGGGGYLDPSCSSSLEVNIHVQPQPPVVTVAPMSLHHIGGGRKNSMVYTISHVEDRSSPNNKYEISSSYGSRTFGHVVDNESSSSHHHHTTIPFVPHHLVPYYSPQGGGSYTSTWPSSASITHGHGIVEESPEFVEQDSAGAGSRRYHSNPWRHQESPNHLQQHNPHGYASPGGVHNSKGVVDPSLPSPPSLQNHPLSLSALFPQLRLQSSTSSAVRGESLSPSSTSISRSPVRTLSSPRRDYETSRASSSRSSMDHRPMSVHSPSSTKIQHFRDLNNSRSNLNSSEDDENVPVRAHSNPTRTSLSPADALEPVSSQFRSVQQRSSPFVDVLDRVSGGGTFRIGPENVGRRPRHKSQSEMSAKRDFLLPKKRHWEPSDGSGSSGENVPLEDYSPNSRSSTSEIQSVLEKKRKFAMNLETSKGDFGEESRDETSLGVNRQIECVVSTEKELGAIDLSMSQSLQANRVESLTEQKNRLSPTSKFSIAYLSKSESIPVSDPLTTGIILEDDDCDRKLVQGVEKCNTRRLKDDKGGLSLTCTETSPPINDGEPDIPKIECLEKSSSVENVSSDQHTSSLMMAESFTRRTIEYFVAKEEEAQSILNEIRRKQLNFLDQLGLVTPEEKLGLEVKALCRSEGGTVPPLKLREVWLPKICSRLENEDFCTSSSTVSEIDNAQASFLQSLGLRPSSIAERSKREHNADVICSHQIQAVPSNSMDSVENVSSDIQGTNLLAKPMYIRYPKYVPVAGDIKSANQQHRGSEQKKSNEQLTEPVLRIPVIYGFKQKNSTFTRNNSDNEDSLSQPIRNETGSTRVLESILEKAVLQWKKSQKLLVQAMNDTKESFSLDEQLLRLEAIRKHLSIQQFETQETEGRFEDLEKFIFEKLESLLRNRQSLPKP